MVIMGLWWSRRKEIQKWGISHQKDFANWKADSFSIIPLFIWNCLLWSSCFSEVSYNTAMVQNFRINPVFVFDEKAPAMDDVQDKLVHGIINQSIQVPCLRECSQLYPGQWSWKSQSQVSSFHIKEVQTNAFEVWSWGNYWKNCISNRLGRVWN